MRNEFEKITRVVSAKEIQKMFGYKNVQTVYDLVRGGKGYAEWYDGIDQAFIQRTGKPAPRECFRFKEIKGEIEKW